LNELKKLLHEKRVEILKYILSKNIGVTINCESEQERDILLLNWNNWRSKIRKQYSRGRFLYENALLDGITIGKLDTSHIYIIPNTKIDKADKLILKLADWLKNSN